MGNKTIRNSFARYVRCPHWTEKYRCACLKGGVFDATHAEHLVDLSPGLDLLGCAFGGRDAGQEFDASRLSRSYIS